jgi:putative ATPase
MLNGTDLKTADIKEAISRSGTLFGVNGTLIYLDEVQYLSKKQQQSLLESVESGQVTLIASTTENPSFYVYGALLSRCHSFEFLPISRECLIKLLTRAKAFLEKESGKTIDCAPEIFSHIAKFSGGDARRALNIFELISQMAESADSGSIKITAEIAESVTNGQKISYNKTGDDHYELLSAFQKSMRGSDPNAAIHYLARLLKSGDIKSACRRLMICACEDVGLASPQIIPIVRACVQIALDVGLPEARIPLSDAVILVCNSPKSISAYSAINEAALDLESGQTYAVPRLLDNSETSGYVYPQVHPNHWVPQNYMPKGLEGKIYYEFGDNKQEQAFAAYWARIKNPAAYAKKDLFS